MSGPRRPSSFNRPAASRDRRPRLPESSSSSPGGRGAAAGGQPTTARAAATWRSISRLDSPKRKESPVSGVALSLVLLAAVLHASWNLLAKAADDKLAALWCAALVAVLLYLPIGLGLLLTQPVAPLGWAVVVVSALIEAGYYWWL